MPPRLLYAPGGRVTDKTRQLDLLERSTIHDVPQPYSRLAARPRLIFVIA
jgi:hypothetical protein